MSEPNGVMMQYFHWYIPPDGTLWNQVKDSVQTLAYGCRPPTKALEEAMTWAMASMTCLI